MEYFFILDLSFHHELKAYLPSFYINSKSEFRYIEKKATEEVLQSFGLNKNTNDKDLNRILELVQLLQPEKLNDRFSKKVKKGHFLEDKPLALFYFQYLDDRLNELLLLAKKTQLQLTLNLYQEKDFVNKKINYTDKQLTVSLFFNKTEDGLEYKLSLLDDNTIYFPFQEKIYLITNTTFWFVLNNELVQLKEINTNKLKPFLTKQKVQVPERILASYFNSFIKDIVQKVEIYTNGFEVVKHNTLTSCSLQTEIDSFNNMPCFILLFHYNQIVFTSENQKSKHVNIAFENNEIVVTVTQRNTEIEKEFITKLIPFNFINKENKKWYSEKNTNSLYHQINNIKTELTNDGFIILPFHYNTKEINLQEVTIKSNITEKNDWFDVNIAVIIGNLSIPFVKFIPFLKSKKLVFHLPDDTVFLIPEEWLSKYNSLITHVKITNDERVELHKTKVALLENVAYTVSNTEKITLSTKVNATLRPYQKKGVQWLLQLFLNGFGACLADDMGLGKTLQILSYFATIQDSQLITSSPTTTELDLFSEIEIPKPKLKALIVAPKSLLFNWYRESKKFTPFFHCTTYIGNDRKLNLKRLKNYDLVFTSYGTFNKDYKELEKTAFNFIVIDESQNIKNKDSVSYKNLELITAQQKIVLSGTPIENSIADVWSQMQLINKNVLGNFAYFKKNYLIPIEKKQDENQLSELKQILSPFILRRTKEEVLQELPEKMEQIIYCKLTDLQAKEYEKEKSKARNSLLSIENNKPDQIQILKSLLRLRQWSNHPKLIDVASEIESGKFMQITQYLLQLLENNKKVLLFSSFVKHIELYEIWCTENNIPFQTLTGKTKIEEREQLVSNFQTKEKPLLFFISLKAGETGLNLTKASYVLFLDPWWNPYKENQALSRAHRMGQKEKVNIIRFISENTIEEKIIQLQEKKKALGRSIFEIENNSDIINQFEDLIE
jgi:SNF2 family DNA or RNA helicase